MRPVIANVSSLLVATRFGGWGCWTGLGTTAMRSISKKRPWWETRSLVQAWRMISSPSPKRSRFSAIGTPKARK